MRDSLLGLAVALLLAAPAAAQDGIEELRLGQPRSGSVGKDDPRLLQDGPTRRLRLHSKADGKATISANSFDFDVYLRVETEAGDVVAEADGGGIETNARLVVELARDKSYHVLVAAKGGGSGWFWIDGQAGERPPLSRESVQIAAVAYHGGAANAELQNGEKAAAAAHLQRKGSILLEQGKLDEAEQAFESARAFLEESKDAAGVVRATLDLGRVASAEKDWKRADELFATALAAYRAIPDASGEARTLVAQGDARAAAGDVLAASTFYQEALAVAEKHADADSAALALAGSAALTRAPDERGQEREAAERLGDLWRAGGDLAKAREQYEKAREIAREAKDRAAEGAAWSSLGGVWLQAQELAHARECFQRALEIAEERKDAAAQADALESLAGVWFRLEDHAKALKLQEQQLAVAGSDAGRAGRANLGIGKCCVALRDFARARKILEAEVERSRRSGDANAEADALLYLSSIDLRSGDRDAADEARNRAAQLRQGADSKGWIAVFKGIEHFDRGRIDEAQAIFEKSVESARSNDDRGVRMHALLRLGQCHSTRGRYSDSIRCFTEAVEIARGMDRRFDEGELLELLGGEYLSIGALDLALDHYEEALAIGKESGDPWFEVQALNGVGNVWLDLLQPEKARAAFEQVEKLGRELGLPIVEAVSRNNIGCAYLKADLYAEGRPFLEQAVTHAAEIRALIHRAEFQGNLACVLRKLGDEERARELAEESLAVLGAPGAGEPRKTRAPLQALVGLAIHDADLAGANSYLDRADSILEEIRVEALAAPGEIGADPWIFHPPFDRFRQDLVRQMQLDGGLAPADLEKEIERGFRDADRARARHLASSIVGHRRGARSKDTQSLRAEWRQALARLSDQQRATTRAIRDGESAEKVDALQAELSARRTRAEDLGNALRAISPADAALDLPEGVDPAAVRATGATKGCALVEYADGDEELYAYVLTDTGLSLLELGKRKAIDAVVERYLALVGARKGPASPKEIAQVGRELHDLLLAAPLAAAGPGTARLLVVPTPSLAVLPFDALVVSAEPDPQGFEDLRFVIDQVEVDYCPSASILVLLSSAGPRKLGGKILVLADPVYPSEETAVEAAAPAAEPVPSFLAGTRGVLPEGREFQRLVKTREEAITIAALLIGDRETDAQARLTRLQRERGGLLRANHVDLCLGSDASAARLTGDLRPYAALHLAAHGWVDSQDPEKTGIALSWSGTGDYDGFFTLSDAVGLDLDANFVVLSACETARGKVRVGEGVESMACAFLSAGSRGVVASLWQVDDLAAAETMKSLYAGSLKGDPPAAALHAAKLAIRHGSITRGLAQKTQDGGRRDKGNPCDWAPFIHIGRPR